MLWRFVREFPVGTQPRARSVAAVFVNVSFSVGAALFAINAIAWFGDSRMQTWLVVLFELLDRYHPERGLLASALCHCGPRYSISPVEDAA